MSSVKFFKELEEEIIEKALCELKSSDLSQFINMLSPFERFTSLLIDSLINSAGSFPENKSELVDFIQSKSGFISLEILLSSMKIIRNIFFEILLCKSSKEGKEILHILRFFDGLEIFLISKFSKSSFNTEGPKRLLNVHKMSVIGKLSGYIAHEFNNIFTVIKNWAQLGMMEPDEEIRKKAFEGIIKSSERASVLTKGVLAFYRRMSLDKEVIDINSFMDEILVTIEKKITKEEIILEKNYGKAIPEFKGDKFKLREAVFNVLVNCCDSLKEENRRITLSTAVKDGMIEIIISDTGRGIPESDIEKVFEPFFSTRSFQDKKLLFSTGIGLGLTAAHNIIKSHRGVIKILKTSSEGTDFGIYLPLKD